jgi:superfamily II DNA/RNA helicase
MLAKVLERLKIDELNEMQNAAFESIGKDNDVVVLSPTGSGKTFAFLLPLLQKFNKDAKGVQSLVIVPSRELAQQIEQVFKSMQSGYKITCCYGGHSTKIETSSLGSYAPAIIVGTPGRLAYHIRNGNFDVSTVKYLVLDEFDKSLEFGFEEEMSFIVGELFKLEQKVLTSATAMEEYPPFIGLKNPEVLNFLTLEAAQPILTTAVVQSKTKDKLDVLLKLLCLYPNESTLVFCNHRDAVDRITEMLYDKGIINGVYHGGLQQPEREKALLKFRNGTFSVLVTTDLASRGLDIPEIQHVIHYQIPHTEDAFIHRNGRTARMKAEGKAYLLLSEDERVPTYLPTYETVELAEESAQLPPLTSWVTFFIAAGKKDKINKMDIAGLFYKKANLQKDDLGIIEVYDHMSYVAVNRKKARTALKSVSNEKVKGRKYKMGIDE